MTHILRTVKDSTECFMEEHLSQSYKWFYATYKVGRFFQLKSATPITMSSNLVYQFLCSCGTNFSYVGMSSRHLGTRAREHLNLADIQKVLSKTICTIVTNALP